VLDVMELQRPPTDLPAALRARFVTHAIVKVDSTDGGLVLGRTRNLAVACPGLRGATQLAHVVCAIHAGGHARPAEAAMRRALLDGDDPIDEQSLRDHFLFTSKSAYSEWIWLRKSVVARLRHLYAGRRVTRRRGAGKLATTDVISQAAVREVAAAAAAAVLDD
jgi:hypothetical protein